MALGNCPPKINSICTTFVSSQFLVVNQSREWELRGGDVNELTENGTAWIGAGNRRRRGRNENNGKVKMVTEAKLGMNCW